MLSGRAHQIAGAAAMPAIWRRMALAGGIGQAVAGYLMVALFEWTGSYTPVFLIGAVAFAIGAAICVGLGNGDDSEESK